MPGEMLPSRILLDLPADKAVPVLMSIKIVQSALVVLITDLYLAYGVHFVKSHAHVEKTPMWCFFCFLSFFKPGICYNKHYVPSGI